MDRICLPAPRCDNSPIHLDARLRREAPRRFLLFKPIMAGYGSYYFVMKLRDHPLMSYHGLRNWPPVWVGTADRVNSASPAKSALSRGQSHSVAYTRIFLLIEHEEGRYTGCLFFDDRAFAAQSTISSRAISGRAYRRLRKSTSPRRFSAVAQVASSRGAR